MKQTAVQQWKDTETALRVARSGVLLTGPPSTGKSWAAKTLGLNFNGHRPPVYVVQCTDEPPGVVAVGYERIVGGNMVFTPGPMPRAWGYDEDACLTGKPNGCVGRLVIEEIDKESFDAWIEPIPEWRFRGDTLELHVPSDLFNGVIRQNYAEQIEAIASEIAGREVRLAYQVEPDE